EGHVSPILQRLCEKACVEQLLEEKADVNATDAEGCTPLHWAAMDGQNGVIDCLVWGGADLSAQTQKSSTPQDLAKLSLQNDFLDELLEVVQMKEERDALHKDFGELQHILHQLKVPKEVLTRPEELILRGPVATGNTGYAGYAAQAGQAQGTLLHKRVGDKGMQLLARQLGHNTSMRNLTVACMPIRHIPHFPALGWMHIYVQIKRAGGVAVKVEYTKVSPHHLLIISSSSPHHLLIISSSPNLLIGILFCVNPKPHQIAGHDALIGRFCVPSVDYGTRCYDRAAVYPLG
ncbi:hypothetical protein CYMTET_24383, partial [Cymbomonas tetramitiformis]